jgi:hypothetical protein
VEELEAPLMVVVVGEGSKLGREGSWYDVVVIFFKKIGILFTRQFKILLFCRPSEEQGYM